MNTSLDQLQEWMDSKESERLEFKEAKQNFHFEKLVKYCAALANEGGGKIILGINDKMPRRVVGCHAFDQLERTKAGLIDRLRLRIEGEEIAHPEGRVLIFHRKHLQDCGEEGCKFEELAQVLPSLSRYQIHALLKDFKREGKIRVEGRTKAGKWFAT